MNTTQRRIISTAIFLALVLMLTPNALAERTGDTSSFVASGPTSVEGQLSLVDIRLANDMDMDGKVASMFGYHYTIDTVRAGVEPAVIRVDDPENCDPEQIDVAEEELGCTRIDGIGSPDAPLRNVHLDVADLAAENYFRIFPWGHGASVASSHALLDGLGADQIYARGGFTPKEPGEPTANSGPESNQDPVRDLAWFTTRVVDDAVFVEAQGNSHIVHITGDFVIELRGAAIGVRTASEYAEYRTDNRTSDGVVQEHIQQFLRLFVTDAKLTLRLEHGKVATAGHAARISSDATDLLVTTDGGLGFLPTAEGGQRIVPAPYVVEMAASDGGDMGIDVVDYYQPEPESSIIAGVEMTPTMWSLVASLAAVGIGAYVIRAMTVPPLPKVEAALQSGAYRKAARLSTRILRANPRQESAHLSRAIAWSRAGQNDRIVRHVEPFLRRHEPSDGTIHYVLGLAYLDLGREGDARTMMEEAVARTPSLLAEVSPSLRTTRHEGDAYT